MKRYTVQPVERERPFEVNELFFSFTDQRGVIQTCNEVFVRISGYAQDELIGAPHNIIRHPEMPRIIFKYLWDYLLAGKKIAAYVKNMAIDGSYYWVLALAVPAAEGFLSIRFKPTSEFLPVISDLYKKLLTIEQHYLSDWRAGMAASERELISSLKSLGYASYSEFMHWILQHELKSRDRTLRAQNMSLIPVVAKEKAHTTEARIAAIALSLYQKLDGMFSRLDEYSNLDRILDEKASAILNYTEGFRFISLNTSVRSSRLGATGAPLAVISDYMRNASTSITSVLDELSHLANFISSEISTSLFTISSAKLQIEMLLSYALNVEDSSDKDTSSHSTTILKKAMETSMQEIHTSLEEIGVKLAGLDDASMQLDKAMTSLQFIQISGLVEAVGLHQSGGFHLIFTEVRERIDDAKIALGQLSQTIRQLSQLRSDRHTIDCAFKEYESECWLASNRFL